MNDQRPDQFCITTPDGACVSEDPRCMHNIHQPAHRERYIDWPALYDEHGGGG